MHTGVSSDELVYLYIDAYKRFDIDAMCALASGWPSMVPAGRRLARC